jgi:hypothetical protein
MGSDAVLAAKWYMAVKGEGRTVNRNLYMKAYVPYVVKE